MCLFPIRIQKFLVLFVSMCNAMFSHKCLQRFYSLNVEDISASVLNKLQILTLFGRHVQVVQFKEGTQALSNMEA